MPNHDPKVDPDTVVLYCDGGCHLANPSFTGGAWAVVAADHTGAILCEASGVLTTKEDGVPDPQRGGVNVVSNNLAELWAIVMALESATTPHALDRPRDVLVRSDSLVSIRRATDPFGAKMAGVPDSLLTRLRTVHLIRQQSGAKTAFELLCGHPSRQELVEGKGERGYPVHEYNVRADALCTEAMKAYFAPPEI